MRKRTQLREKLSYANVMVTILAFIVLGGGAFAATKLPKNSVGTRQLKKNSVTKAKIRKNSVNGSKVKNNSLTGADIKLSKLGTVPSAKSAATANTANTASSLVPLEATHLVGTPGEPPFESGSSNFPTSGGASLLPVGFYKDHEGIVHLQGVAKVGAGTLISKIFTLPEGYRPASGAVVNQIVLCNAASGEACKEDHGGDEQYYSSLIVSGSNTSLGPARLDGAVISEPERTVSLDGITFRAES